MSKWQLQRPCGSGKRTCVRLLQRVVLGPTVVNNMFLFSKQQMLGTSSLRAFQCLSFY